jgi:hypothetical protein
VTVTYVNPKVKNAPELTWMRVRELLDYDPISGVFSWRIDGRNKVAGKKLGTNSNGYLIIGIDGRRYRVNRLAWFWMYGVWPNAHIDHRNGDTAVNRASNLREATPQMNQANSKLPKNNTTGFKGVRWSKAAKKFTAQIMFNRKSIHLGCFDEADDAAVAYNLAAIKYFGPFARLNEI